MSNAFQLSALAEIPEPLLTVYLATNPALQGNTRPIPGYLTWMKTEARRLLSNGYDSPLLRSQIERVEEFLLSHRMQHRGVVLFASPGTWKQIVLQDEPQNEAHWGKPMLWQLCSMANQRKTAHVTVVDLSGARFFLYDSGELHELGSRPFKIDASQWKEREHAHMAKRGTRVPHGTQRDIFERRVETQYLHLLADVGNTITRFCKTHAPDKVYILGSDRLTQPVERKLPQALRKQVTRIAHVCGDEPPARTRACVEAELRSSEMERKEHLVEYLLNRKTGIVTGLDQTLAQLQRGRLASLVIAEGFNPVLQECAGCGLTTASPVLNCPQCQAPQTRITLHEALPALLVKHACRLEIVSGRAASRLHTVGGIGGSTRAVQRKKPAASVSHLPAVQRIAAVPLSTARAEG